MYSISYLLGMNAWFDAVTTNENEAAPGDGCKNKLFHACDSDISGYSAIAWEYIRLLTILYIYRMHKGKYRQKSH